MSDEIFLKLAFAEGKKSTPKHPFGAVVVKDEEVIGKGFSHAAKAKNPTAHAEVSALIEACKKLGSNNIPGTTLYSSHEPCLMCFCCAAWADVDRVVFAVPASEISGDMFEFRGVNIFDMAEKLQRQIKVEQIKV